MNRRHWLIRSCCALGVSIAARWGSAADKPLDKSTPTDSESNDGTVRIAFVGDLMLDNLPGDMSLRQATIRSACCSHPSIGRSHVWKSGMCGRD